MIRPLAIPLRAADEWRGPQFWLIILAKRDLVAQGQEGRMKLYDTARAPNPRRVRIFLAEKGLSVPTEQVDLRKLEQKAESFRTLNPLQSTPVLLLDDGTALSESVAICRYFEELKPEPPLFGQGILGRALVEMWQRRIELHFLLPVLMSFRHSHPAMAELEKPQIPQFAETSRARALDFLHYLDGELAQRPFAAGEAYSIADITTLVAVDFLKLAKIEIPAECAALKAWHAQVAARPSAVP
jgi:glutathione S-transferase